jgi:type IV pilus assembly protein PilA
MIKALRNKKGVTLVELLAVVVILGIIAAIAVPTIGGLIERQEANAAEATYDTIVTAAELYAEDATAFTLATLESEDFIDLKDNQFGWEAEEVSVTSANVWVVVSGGTVYFFESDPGATPDLGTASDLYINGHLGNPAE